MKDVRGPGYSWRGLGTERFRIRTEYFYHGPVTVVECLDVEEPRPARPSDAVLVLRRYLMRKLAESDSDLRMEFMGPSPFHANFFVRVDEAEDSVGQVERKAQLGYDVVEVRLPPDDFGDAIEWFLHHAGNQLSFFYQMLRIERRRSISWQQIEREWKNLHASVEEQSITGKVTSIYGRRRKIAKLVNQTMLFRANTMFEHRAGTSDRKDLLAREDVADCLREYVSDSFDEAFAEYPTSEVLEFARFYESRDAKWRDRIYFLLAAAMGGAIGAAMTIRWGAT